MEPGGGGGAGSLLWFERAVEVEVVDRFARRSEGPEDDEGFGEGVGGGECQPKINI